MKITNLELITIQEGLLELSLAKGISTKASYNCARSIKKCKEVIDVYLDERKKILEERCLSLNGKIDTTDNKYHYENSEVEQEVFKKVEELNKLEVDVDLFTIKIVEIEGSKDITGQTMLKLMDKFITE